MRDFDEGEFEDGFEIFFERSDEAVPRARPAFLAIVQAGPNRRSILQNIRIPRFSDQQSDLVVKCKILKLIGDFIIREGDLLLNIATSGRDIPIDGNLQQKKLINELQLNTSLMHKNGSRLSSETLPPYVSKIKRFENIQLPNGKVYSLTQFLRGEGRYAGLDRFELLKYLVGKDKMGDTALSKSFIEDKGKKYTVANKKAVFDGISESFFNLKSSIEKHIANDSGGLQPWESAAFFLSQRLSI
ncbi:MAG: hypothetical protein IPI64_00030 [Chloracidobacterium sp.]|nr:hypothetical protein [Chloracidobacterium sp.]